MVTKLTLMGLNCSQDQKPYLMLILLFYLLKSDLVVRKSFGKSCQVAVSWTVTVQNSADSSTLGLTEEEQQEQNYIAPNYITFLRLPRKTIFTWVKLLQWKNHLINGQCFVETNIVTFRKYTVGFQWPLVGISTGSVCHRIS